DREALRRNDIGQFTVLIAEQRDEGGAVRIIFEALDLCAHAELASLEVDDPVGALVTAAAETRRDAAEIVAAAARDQPFGEALDGLALVQAGAVDEHQLALTRCRRIVFLECHDPTPRLLTDPLRCRSTGLR